jgi:hypothetical protein
MAHEVFISYSSKDKPTADAMCARLEAHGIRCWIAPRDVLPGEPYGEGIVNAIHSSRLMVLIFSAGSNSSQQVMREVERAVSTGIAILPFRIEDVPLSPSMEYFISAPHWLDALTGPLEEHLERLAATVEAILARGDSAAQPVGRTQPVQVTAPSPPPPAINRQTAITRLPLALAGAALLIFALGGIWGISRLQNHGMSDPPSSDRNASSQKEASSAPDEQPAESSDGSGANAPHPAGNLQGKIGEELSDGSWRFQLLDFKQVPSYTLKRTTEADYAAYNSSAEFTDKTFTPKSGNTFLVFHCRVVNVSKEKQALWLRDSNTAVLSDRGESSPPITYDIRGGIIQSESLLPGSTLEFEALFAVPQDWKSKELVFTLKNIGDKTGTDVHITL